MIGSGIGEPIPADQCASAGGENLGLAAPVKKARPARYCSTAQSDTTVSYATGVVTYARRAPCAVANKVRRALFSYGVTEGAALCLGTSTGYCPQALPDVRRLKVNGRVWRRTYLFDTGGLDEDAKVIYRAGQMSVTIEVGVVET
jgi:hypothetical protein